MAVRRTCARGNSVLSDSIIYWLINGRSGVSVIATALAAAIEIKPPIRYVRLVHDVYNRKRDTVRKNNDTRTNIIAFVIK